MKDWPITRCFLLTLCSFFFGVLVAESSHNADPMPFWQVLALCAAGACN